MQIINPATEEIIKEIPEHTSQEIQAIFETLKNKQAQWQAIEINKRIKIIKNFKQLLTDNIELLAQDLTNEVGKPIQQSHNEIKGACQRIQYFIDHSKNTLKDTIEFEDDTIKEILSFEPLGTICNISAWNYPYLVGVNVIIPALIAGNTVCYKPSEFALLTGLNIERLLLEAGIPDYAFATVIGGGDAGQALLSKDFDGFFFTGSYRTGKKIAEFVADRLVPIGLELGGKDPVYVREDIHDIPTVAAAIVDGAFYNNGQSCCSVERIYVHEKIMSEFIDAFVAEAQQYEIAPLTRQAQIKLLEDQIADAVEKGATLHCGGKRIDKPGYFFEPTVLSSASHEMKIMREESFGPVIGIQSVSHDAEAVQLMNDTDYGLTAAIYSSDSEKSQKLMQQLNAGTVYFNCCDRVSPHLPWSGRKHSGLGSTLSYLGIKTFANPKAYHIKII